MITTQSRFHTVFGGAAGYIALTFVILLVVSHLQQNYQLVPLRPYLEETISATKEAVGIQPEPKSATGPQKAIQTRTPVRPSDMIPSPEEYANDIAVLRKRGLLFPLQ